MPTYVQTKVNFVFLLCAFTKQENKIYLYFNIDYLIKQLKFLIKTMSLTGMLPESSQHYLRHNLLNEIIIILTVKFGSLFIYFAQCIHGYISGKFTSSRKFLVVKN